MKLSAREDIAAPIDHVFDQASDFANFERRAMREGASVTRQDQGPVTIGSVWHIDAPFRGKMRHFIATLTALQAPDSYVVTTQSDGVILLTRLDLVALSPTQTRVTMVVEISARSLAARVLVQSLWLVRSRLASSFKSRMQFYARSIAEDYRRPV